MLVYQRVSTTVYDWIGRFIQYLKVTPHNQFFSQEKDILSV